MSWWEYDKDAFLDLKTVLARKARENADFEAMGHVRRASGAPKLRPRPYDIERHVLPVLRKILQDPSTHRDLVSSCMIALAKIGVRSESRELIESYLRDSDQEKRETAALALGILRDPRALPTLVALATDSKKGRKICRKPHVDYRTRSFAIYGLGLLGRSLRDLSAKSTIFQTLERIVDSERGARSDILVAALHAARVLRPSLEVDLGRALARDILEWLEAVAGDTKIQARTRSHALIAIGGLLDADSPSSLRTGARDFLMSALERERKNAQVQRSAVIALGQLGRKDDTRVIRRLLEYRRSGQDRQARDFATIALGKIGGERVRAGLFKALASRKEQTQRLPWISLALAIQARKRAERDPSVGVDATVGDAILKRMLACRNAESAAGHAIALGIMGYEDAGGDVLALMVRYKSQEAAAGYFAVSLGLLQFKEAIPEIQALVARSTRRNLILTQASIALGLLGDPDISRTLTNRIQERGTVAVLSALAQALGHIGDRRCLESLSSLAGDPQQKTLPRAFAAVALGIVCDKDPLPWNSCFAAASNYRANVETLVGSGSGILDIL